MKEETRERKNSLSFGPLHFCSQTDQLSQKFTFNRKYEKQIDRDHEMKIVTIGCDWWRRYWKQTLLIIVSFLLHLPIQVLFRVVSIQKRISGWCSPPTYEWNISGISRINTTIAIKTGKEVAHKNCNSGEKNERILMNLSLLNRVSPWWSFIHSYWTWTSAPHPFPQSFCPPLAPLGSHLVNYSPPIYCGNYQVSQRITVTKREK